MQKRSVELNVVKSNAAENTLEVMRNLTESSVSALGLGLHSAVRRAFMIRGA